MTSMTQGRSVRAAITAIAGIFVMAHSLGAQERGNKLRISNAGFTITALPLLAAKEWGMFAANGDDGCGEGVGIQAAVTQ